MASFAHAARHLTDAEIDQDDRWGLVCTYNKKCPGRDGGSEPAGRRCRVVAGAGSVGAAMTTPRAADLPVVEDEPCRCHRSYAMVSPFHAGHCCFWPASQTCHAEEVAEWERENKRWHGAQVLRVGDGSDWT